MTIQTDKINNLLSSLKSRKLLPSKMDVSKIGNRYWFVCHNGENTNLISESSSTGFADDPSTALMKALSEWVERSAYREGHKKQNPICMTDRSDGFAAFPAFDSDAKTKARESAWYEAIERYVWATWWDDDGISFESQKIDSLSESLNLQTHIEEIKKQCALENVFIVQPQIELAEVKVVIVFGKLKSGGYISGGACGKSVDLKNIILRSFDELYRHGLAAKKINLENSKAKSFYEQRLAFFSLGHGNNLIRSRLEKKGTLKVNLPELAFDNVVSHSLEELFLVHRCLFKNQPPFMGGHLGRFCL